MSATLAGNVYSSRGRAHNDPMGSCFGGDCYRCAASHTRALWLISIQMLISLQPYLAICMPLLEW